MCFWSIRLMLIPIRSSFHFRPFESSITSSHQLPINQKWYHSNLFRIKVHFPTRKERERVEKGESLPSALSRWKTWPREINFIRRGIGQARHLLPLSSPSTFFPNRTISPDLLMTDSSWSHLSQKYWIFHHNLRPKGNIRGKEIKREAIRLPIPEAPPVTRADMPGLSSI